jgi:hypothetical protein
MLSIFIPKLARVMARGSKTVRAAWILALTGFLLHSGVASAGSLPPGFNHPGDILIADQFNNRVIEIDTNGNIIWQFGLGPDDYSPNSIISCNDAQRVGIFTLMAGTGVPPGVIPEATNGFADNRVILVDPFKQIIWQYGQFGVTGSKRNQLNTPVQCTWLPNTDVLITDQGNNRIIEVTLGKKIVWQFPGPNHSADAQLNSPNSAELLANGHILISDENNNRAIEVTRDHQIVQTFTAGGSVVTLAFSSRLPNGDTLLTDAGNARIVEVDTNDAPVWQYFVTNSLGVAAPLPTRAVRLRNGDTLISDQFDNLVLRVDSNKVLVASYGIPPSGGGTLSIPPGSPVGVNIGYSPTTTTAGLYSPYDAKVIGDYTGLTPPFGFFGPISASEVPEP